MQQPETEKDWEDFFGWLPSFSRGRTPYYGIHFIYIMHKYDPILKPTKVINPKTLKDLEHIRKTLGVIIPLYVLFSIPQHTAMHVAHSYISLFTPDEFELLVTTYIGVNDYAEYLLNA